MSKSKLPTSIRLEEERLKELDQLVIYYERQLANEGFHVKLNRSNVIERLIKERYDLVMRDQLMK